MVYKIQYPLEGDQLSLPLGDCPPAAPDIFCPLLSGLKVGDRVSLGELQGEIILSPHGTICFQREHPHWQAPMITLLNRKLAKDFAQYYPPPFSSTEQPPVSAPKTWLVHNHYVTRNGKKYGPYTLERWREGGKLRSRYLGKSQDL